MLPAAAEPQPSQPPCCTAEPTRSGIASVTAESRCPPRRHTSTLFTEKWRRRGWAAVRDSCGQVPRPQYASLGSLAYS